MLKSKTPCVAREFQSLKVKNPPLATLIEALAEYVAVAFRKDVIMTDVYRTSKETQAHYAGMNTKPKVSPHELWLAVDIRDWIYSAAEKDAIVAFLNSNYDEHNRMNRMPSGSRTVWLHNVSSGMHFHIQYSGPMVYVFSRGAEISV